jgi:hypothetical protein
MVNESLRWLNNVSGVYLVQVSLYLIDQAGFWPFLQVSALASHWLEAGQIILQRQRKMTTMTTTPLLSIHNYTPLVIMNDKNK